MISWIKKFLYIIKNYDRDIDKLYAKVHALALENNQLASIIKEHTSAAADLSYHRSVHNYCIVIGHYKGHDYVRCWKLPNDDFCALIDNMRHVAKYHRLSTVDALPEFRAFINKE